VQGTRMFFVTVLQAETAAIEHPVTLRAEDDFPQDEIRFVMIEKKAASLPFLALDKTLPDQILEDLGCVEPRRINGSGYLIDTGTMTFIVLTLDIYQAT